MHETEKAEANPPIWSCMVTRKISLSSPEGKSEAAIKARDKELGGHRQRTTWDEYNAREYRDLMTDKNIPEVMLGLVFGILGEKNAECNDSSYKYRAVFQGSNVRTKTGIDAIDLYQEISSSPVSFVSVRCTLAIAILKCLGITICDALQAYLQARIDGPDRVPTWVELPKDWWPDHWFHKGDRKKPLFVRPVCPLIKA